MRLDARGVHVSHWGDDVRPSTGGGANPGARGGGTECESTRRYISIRGIAKASVLDDVSVERG